MGRTGLQIVGQDESGLLRLAPISRRVSQWREIAAAIGLVLCGAVLVGMMLAGLKLLLRAILPHVPAPPAWLTQLGRHPGAILPGVVVGVVLMVLLVAISGMQSRVAAVAAKDQVTHPDEPVFIGEGRFLDEEDRKSVV